MGRYSTGLTGQSQIHHKGLGFRALVLQSHYRTQGISGLTLTCVPGPGSPNLVKGILTVDVGVPLIHGGRGVHSRAFSRAWLEKE